jgi:flagellar biosynthesis/type III secretory pathway protein FliH
MILPEAAERSFWQELQSFEETTKMTYVTNAERFGMEQALERGIEQGIEQGMERGIEQEARSLVLRLLFRRIGTISPDAETKISTLSVSQLESLGEALLDFSNPTDLEEWLRSS